MGSRSDRHERLGQDLAVSWIGPGVDVVQRLKRRQLGVDASCAPSGVRVRADEIEFLTGQRRPSGESADHSDKISCLGARQLLDHAPAGPLPLLQEDQEIGHLLPVRPLVELPDDVGSDLAGGGQDPKEIPTRRWSERVSEASRILPKHRGASVSAA